MRIPIASITVGERRRQDLGDIGALARSLQSVGLIDPIVVQQDGTLAHGLRRLTAARRAGWTEIEAVRIEDLTHEARFALERELDETHKPLTEAEQARRLVRQAETVAPKVAGRKAEVSVTRDENRGGRPPRRAASREDIADALGVTEPTLRRAEQHVAAVDAHPFMESWSQRQVLAAKQAIDSLPADAAEAIVKVVAQPGIQEHPSEVVPMLQRAAAMTDEGRERIVALATSPDEREQSLAVTILAEKPPQPDPRLYLIDDAVKALNRARREFSDDPFNEPLSAHIDSLLALRNQMREAWKQRAAGEQQVAQ